jgi:hypothetical protein
MFIQANRRQSKLRMTIDGPAGSGKSYTALRLAHVLVQGGRIAAIDTERGSLSKYAGEAPDGIPWAFDVAELTTFSPEKYTENILMAGKAGYKVLIIDSLSHAWEGTGGALEIKDKQGGNQWTAWRMVTPIHNRMIDAILQSPCHIITTMRSRMEYVQEEGPDGKINIKKVGMAPIQRPGMEYEFDVVCDIDWSHILKVSKSRCSAVSDMVVEKPGPGFVRPIIEWLESGVAQPIVPQSNPGAAIDSAVENVSDSTLTFDDLLNQFGVDKVMSVMADVTGGAMPKDNGELSKINEMLLVNETSNA